MAGRLRDWFQEGLYSAIPAATAVDEGALYYATDTDILYRSDGATWTAISSAASQIATHEADTSSAHTAEGIDIVDSGALYTATNVEAALAEVAGDLGALELNDLADVAAGAPSDQDLLTWDDYLGAWVPQAGSVVAALDDLTDVDTYGVTDGQALVYDDYLGEWVPGTVAAGSVALDDLTDVDTYGVTDGEVLTYDDYLGEWVPAASAGGAGPPFPTKLGVVLDAPAASDQVDIIVPFDCTITGVTLLADQSGDIVVDIWKDSYGNHPPTDADSITASAPPTLSTAAKSQDTTLTGWTVSFSAGDWLVFYLSSLSGLTQIDVALDLVKG